MQLKFLTLYRIIVNQYFKYNLKKIKIMKHRPWSSISRTSPDYIYLIYN